MCPSAFKVCALALFVCVVRSAPVDKRQISPADSVGDEQVNLAPEGTSPQLFPSVEEGQASSDDASISTDGQSSAVFQEEGQNSDASGQVNKRQISEDQDNQGEVVPSTGEQFFAQDDPQPQQINAAVSTPDDQGQTVGASPVSKRQAQTEEQSLASGDESQISPVNEQSSDQIAQIETAGVAIEQSEPVNVEAGTPEDQGQATAQVSKRQTSDETAPANQADLEAQAFPQDQPSQGSPAPETPSSDDTSLTAQGESQISRVASESQDGQFAQVTKRQIEAGVETEPRSSADLTSMGGDVQATSNGADFQGARPQPIGDGIVILPLPLPRDPTQQAPTTTK